ncbi:MAG: hypothetical protein QOJ05_1494 [Verrucomicrobiota bacterium]
MNPDRVLLVSIVVPVLNEAALIGDFLRSVRCLGPGIEIIVVDGGSSDGTYSVAGSWADQIIRAPRGRAAQMNAGAAIAHGETIWFLHADSKPPSNALEVIQQTVRDPRVAGGCFRLRYPRREWIYRVSDSLGNLGVKVFGFALGDHGIFCRRVAFQRAGTYPMTPILEDAELYRRLRKLGRMVQRTEAIVSSPRTFEKSGRYRTTAVYFLILVLYVIGVPITRLDRIYLWFHARKSVSDPPVALETG